MAGLCWMVLVLVFSLSAGHTEAMDQNKVQTIAKYILDTYSIYNKNNYRLQFSLAVNIPENLDLQGVFNAHDADTVKKAVEKGDVHKTSNMVAATPLVGEKYTEHAEERVLDNIQPLAASSAGKSLVFYSYLSPCVRKCANPNNQNNILDRINYRISKGQWAETIFVFSTIFQTYKDQNGKEQTFSEEEIGNALKELGRTSLNYNIFRCDYPNNGQFQCIKCFNGEIPVDGCVKK